RRSPIRRRTAARCGRRSRSVAPSWRAPAPAPRSTGRLSSLSLLPHAPWAKLITRPPKPCGAGSALRPVEGYALQQCHRFFDALDGRHHEVLVLDRQHVVIADRRERGDEVRPPGLAV